MTGRFGSGPRRPVPIEGKGAADAHVGPVGGVLQTEQALVTQGDDGSVRFWTKAGEGAEGKGAALAHPGRVVGVLETEAAWSLGR